MVLETSPCTVLCTHRKFSSCFARPVMCLHAIAASWWNIKSTGGAGWLPGGPGRAPGSLTRESAGFPVHGNALPA